MKAIYQFTVILQGTGETEVEAWQDAIDAFCIDPGDPSEVEVLEEEKEV